MDLFHETKEALYEKGITTNSILKEHRVHTWINTKLLKPYPNIMSQKSLTKHFNVNVTTLCQWF